MQGSRCGGDAHVVDVRAQRVGDAFVAQLERGLAAAGGDEIGHGHPARLVAARAVRVHAGDDLALPHDGCGMVRIASAVVVSARA